MKRFATAAVTAAFGFSAFAITGCQGDAPEAATEPLAEEAPLNTLTEAEKAEGWQLLFNGQDFEGWRGFGQDDIPSAWVIDDGALHMTGDSTAQGGDIMTVGTYGNFELTLEYRISECGNSGIMYRVGTEGGAPFMTGPEYQVLDNTCHPDAQNGLNRTAGANYDVNEPTKDVTKPAGEWNQVRIVANGNKVEHWLNGEKVVEYEIGSDDWKQRVAASKWADVKTYASLAEGHIDLQDHNDPVWYRNIKIRPLN